MEARVSVIIPTYKRVKSLENTIESVLNQTYPYVEAIIVDDNDATSDFRKETEKFMKKYEGNKNVVYLKHTHNRNGAAARNTGIKFSEAEYIAFLDDDDVFLPEKISKQLNRLVELKDSKIGAIYCNYLRYSQDTLTRRSKNKYLKDEGNLSEDLLLEKNEIAAGSTLLIKRSIVQELNGFDESYSRHQDWEFLLRYFEKYNLALCEEYLVRINSNDNINKKTPEELVDIKTRFLEKFHYQISNLDIRVQKKIYSKHWIQVAKNFYRDNNFSQGNYYFKKAKGYKGIQLTDKAKIYIYKLNLYDCLNNIKLLIAGFKGR